MSPDIGWGYTFRPWRLREKFHARCLAPLFRQKPAPWRGSPGKLRTPSTFAPALMVQELTAEQIRQALQGISVPPQPQIMVDLQMEQVMPNPDLKNIARLISQDPGLSGALLKLVNSPFFGLANRITSIQRAVNLLGSRSVINLINAQSIKGEMSDDTIVTLNRFWDTAQDVAMSCLSLAKRVGYESVDEAYALGLFHNCGIPLMLKRFPHYMAVLEEAYAAASDERRVVDTENRVLNTNHAVVGYYTARSWRLPEHVCEAIANHHNALSIFGDESARDTQLKNLLAILKMAEHICGSHRILGNQPEDHEWNSIGALVLDYVGLTDYDFENLKGSILELGVGQGSY
ncbi:hypothetical protein PAMH27_0316 [Pseudomonas aeruginosa MH27]|nr:hypothetical protein PAMH27_0316 [Pseudomonas aeruginosa MH27]